MYSKTCSHFHGYPYSAKLTLLFYHTSLPIIIHWQNFVFLAIFVFRNIRKFDD